MHRTAPLFCCAFALAACETNEFFIQGSGGGETMVTVASVVTVAGGGEDDGGDGGAGEGGAGNGGGGGQSLVTGSGGDGAGASGSGSGGTDAGSGGAEPFLDGAPEANTSVEELELDAFGVDGNHYWLAVDPAQVERMNEQNFGGNGDPYSPGGGTGATYVNHLFATTAGDDPQTADFGKVEVRVIGESTFRPWASDSIPNLRVDSEEFQEGLELDGFKDFRFNNGQVGTIFREEIALEVYARLGYPAPLATYAWVGSNVWGPEVEIPYTMIEVYKKDFCDKRPELFPDGCANMWEFVGDFGWTDFKDPENCQFSSCDATRIGELTNLVVATPPSAGFKETLADYIDWDSMHRAQCISWMLWTGDDTFHNNNNNVLVERGDGKFQYLPYSIDISGGQDWYQFTPLYGNNMLSRGCQSDAACWADTIATCESLIEDFVALDPAGLVDEVYGRLESNGMLRDGDEGRYDQVRAWYAQRAVDLTPELEQFRAPACGVPDVKCNGSCIPAEQCVPECDDGFQACGPQCAFPFECWECNFPFTWCGDGSCMLQDACPG